MWPFGKQTKSLIAPPMEVKYASFITGMGGARWLERRFDLMAQHGYEQNPIVYACVSKLAKSLASVDLQLYRKRGGTLERVEDHPALKLIERPNPIMGSRRFLELMATDYLVGGNTFVRGSGPESGPPRELWIMPSDKVAVKDGRRSFIPDAYEYHEKQQSVERFPVDQLTGQCDVLHLKTPNPLNPLIGLPPMVAAFYGVQVFNAGQEWNKSLLENGAKPSGALTVKDGEGKPASLSVEEYQRTKNMIDDHYSGARNAARPMLLEGGLEWQAMSMSPVDMDHRETMLTNARFIAGVYQTPPQLVNIPGESTYSNYGEAKLAYWADTVLPLLGTMLEDLSNWLLPQFGDDLFFWYDEEMIPALEPLRTEKAQRVNASGYMTINEKRRAMGLDDIDGGDTVLVQASTIPLELAGGMELPEPGSEADQGGDE